MSAGTGGTLAGVSAYLTSGGGPVRVSLAAAVVALLPRAPRRRVFSVQRKRTARRNRYGSPEGVGLDRVSANYERAAVDDAFARRTSATMSRRPASLRKVS